MLLLLAMFAYGRPAVSTAAPSDPDQALILELEAKAENAVNRLETICRLSEKEKEDLQRRVKNASQQALSPVSAAVGKIHGIIDRDIGWRDSLPFSDSSPKLEAATKEAKLADAIGHFQVTLVHELENVSRGILDDKLSEVGSETRRVIGGSQASPVDDYLVTEFLSEVRKNLPGASGNGAGPSVTSDKRAPKTSLALAVGVVVKNVFQFVGRASAGLLVDSMGGTVLRKIVENAAFRSLLTPGEGGGPPGWVLEGAIVGVGALYDLFRGASTARESAKKKFSDWYSKYFHEPLSRIQQDLNRGLQNELSGTLQHVKSNTQERLKAAWDGIFLHRKSADFTKWAEGRSVQEVLFALRKVAAAFGRNLPDASMAEKLDMIHGIGQQATRHFIEKYERRFFDLWRKNPERIKSVIDQAPWNMLERVLESSRPNDELDFLQEVLEGIGDVRERKGTYVTVPYVHQMLPDLPAHKFTLRRLEELEGLLDSLRELGRTQESIAKKLLSCFFSGGSPSIEIQEQLKLLAEIQKLAGQDGVWLWEQLVGDCRIAEAKPKIEEHLGFLKELKGPGEDKDRRLWIHLLRRSNMPDVGRADFETFQRALVAFSRKRIQNCSLAELQESLTTRSRVIWVLSVLAVLSAIFIVYRVGKGRRPHSREPKDQVPQ